MSLDNDWAEDDEDGMDFSQPIVIAKGDDDKVSVPTVGAGAAEDAAAMDPKEEAKMLAKKKAAELARMQESMEAQQRSVDRAAGEIERPDAQHREDGRMPGGDDRYRRSQEDSAARHRADMEARRAADQARREEEAKLREAEALRRQEQADKRRQQVALLVCPSVVCSLARLFARALVVVRAGDTEVLVCIECHARALTHTRAQHDARTHARTHARSLSHTHTQQEQELLAKQSEYMKESVEAAKERRRRAEEEAEAERKARAAARLAELDRKMQEREAAEAAARAEREAAAPPPPPPPREHLPRAGMGGMMRSGDRGGPSAPRASPWNQDAVPEAEQVVAAEMCLVCLLALSLFSAVFGVHMRTWECSYRVPVARILSVADPDDEHTRGHTHAVVQAAQR